MEECEVKTCYLWVSCSLDERVLEKKSSPSNSTGMGETPLGDNAGDLVGT